MNNNNTSCTNQELDRISENLKIMDTKVDKLMAIVLENQKSIKSQMKPSETTYENVVTDVLDYTANQFVTCEDLLNEIIHLLKK